MFGSPCSPISPGFPRAPPPGGPTRVDPRVQNLEIVDMGPVGKARGFPSTPPKSALARPRTSPAFTSTKMGVNFDHNEPNKIFAESLNKPKLQEVLAHVMKVATDPEKPENERDTVRLRRFFDRDLNSGYGKAFLDDGTRVDCAICCTIAADRCSFCLKGKASRMPRLHIKELGTMLLKRRPNLETKTLIQILHDYGRSSEYAKSLNARLKWPRDEKKVEEKSYCPKHTDM